MARTKKFVPPEVPQKEIKVIIRDASDMRLEEWRCAPNLVSEGIKLLKSQPLRIILDILRNEAPVNFGLPELGVTDTDALRHLGKCEGYQMALNNLEAFGIPLQTSQPMVATFEKPEPELK